MNYAELYHQSINEKDSFWLEQTKELVWFHEPTKGSQKNSSGYYQWFSDGEMNIAYNCLDANIIGGKGSQTALVFDSPATGTTETYTYFDLHNSVNQFAAGLLSLGITKGDRVVIYMPMIPQAVISMLACARIGAIHSVVFGGFAPHELALRIDDATPKALITASFGMEFDRKIAYMPLVNEALKETTFKPDHIIHFNRIESDPVNYTYLLNFESLLLNQQIDAVPVNATHPLYILYTSGTTGKPKGIVRDHGGYATALKFSMSKFYNCKPGDVYWAASDVGWVVGHSYIVYGPLLQGCTTVLYEGKPIRTPDAGAFWRMIEKYRVNIMFTAPTAIRAIKKEDPEGEWLKQFNLQSLRTLFLAGERCDPNTYNWISDLLQKPVIDHWWQTESGWPMIGIMTGLHSTEPKAGAAGLPVAGFNIQILSESGEPLAPHQEGIVAIKLPLPPGCMLGLWNNEERFKKGYLDPFPGYYFTGDGGHCDEDHFFYIMGRVDDVINVSGHRLSTGEMEEWVANHPAIAECAVVGIKDDLRGQRPVAFVVLKDGQHIQASVLQTELVATIREKIGAIAFFKTALIVKRLPKTRSGKILRKTIRQICDNENFSIPSTIDDPSILDELKITCKEL